MNQKDYCAVEKVKRIIIADTLTKAFLLIFFTHIIGFSTIESQNMGIAYDVAKCSETGA